MRISDWSSDVCSSDLRSARPPSLSERLISPTPSLLNPYRPVRRRGCTCRIGQAASPFPVHPRIRPLWWNRSTWARLRHRGRLTFLRCQLVYSTHGCSDRKDVVVGKGGAERVVAGGWSLLKKQQKQKS